MGNGMFADISTYQRNINWEQYRNWSKQVDGRSRVAIRTTYGMFIDDMFHEHYKNALNVGIDEIYFYSYAYPQLTNAYDAANKFCATVGKIRVQDAIFLDYEENVPEATGTWAHDFCQQCSNCGYPLVGIYASDSFIKSKLQVQTLEKYLLWYALWTFHNSPIPNNVPFPWKSANLWQFADNQFIPGIGQCDCNIAVDMPTLKKEKKVLNRSEVQEYFPSGDDIIWTCTNGKVIGHAILNFYRSYIGDGLCGFSDLGLPVTNEISLIPNTNVVGQEFERGYVIYDPDHKTGWPPGAIGPDCYKGLIAQSPTIQTLKSPVASFTEINQLATQIVKLSTVQ